MRTEVRHRLKEDAFAQGTREIFDWIMEHRTNLLSGILVAAIVVGGYMAWWNHDQNRDEQANLQFAQALRTLNAPVGAGGEPGVETYPTDAARDAAAQKTLDEVVSKYGNTAAGHYAAYYLGVIEMNQGKTDAAEQQFKKVISSDDKDAAALAKMALASLYISNGKSEQAVALCNELIAKPTATVPKEQAQMRLAAAYAVKQPEEARKIYVQLAAADPGGPIGSVASQRMAALK